MLHFVLYLTHGVFGKKEKILSRLETWPAVRGGVDKSSNKKSDYAIIDIIYCITWAMTYTSGWL